MKDSLPDFNGGQEQLLSLPVAANWNLSSRCNFDCLHCYSRLEKFEEPSRTTVSLIVRKLAEYRISSVNIGGGEPLLRRDLFDIIKEGTALGLNFSLSTNGFLISAEKAELLRESGLRKAEVSLDSDDPVVHDRFRRKRGSHARALKAVSFLREAGLPVDLSTVITRENHLNFEKIIALAARVGIRKISFHNFKCGGTGGLNRGALDLQPREWKDFYLRLRRVSLEEKGILLSVEDPILCTLEEPGLTGDSMKGSICGKLTMCIKPNGDITPCAFVSLRLGNILEDDLRAIWKDSEALHRYRNKKPQGKCLGCRWYEDCRGGCTARAYLASGDFNAPDPHCWL
jgi:GeoRSP system radical SAM/SPASM protein